jgi:transcriptional regulator with XRE-family HTH domain
MTTLSRVNGTMLKWGRERALMSKQQVAARLHSSVAEIESWENSTNNLTLKKALDYANVVHIPFGYLYAPT